jgi:hypothetical protein
VIRARTLAAGLSILLAAPLAAQEMGGIALNAPLPDTLPDPVGSQVQGPFAFTLWQRADGTAMSATVDARTGETLYVEIWNADGGPRAAPLPGMTFGETTQADLIARFGSEGMIFGERGRTAVAGDQAAFFHSYEIDGSDAVLSFVTILPLDIASPETAGTAVLDSVILGYGPYLDAIWGANRGRIDGYAPIPGPFDG